MPGSSEAEEVEHVEGGKESAVERKEAEPSFLKKVEGMHESVVDSVADAFAMADKLVHDPDSTPAIVTEAIALKNEASAALTRFYTKGKKATEAIPKVFSSGKADGDRPPVFDVLDAFIDSDLVAMYERCAAFKAARVDGKMTPEETAFRESLAKRFMPFGYGEDSDVMFNIERLDQITKGPEIYTKEEVAANTTGIVKVRFDLFRTYLGLPPYSDNVIPSPHRPTKATNPDARYVAFDPRRILESVDVFEAKRREIMVDIKRTAANRSYPLKMEYSDFPEARTVSADDFDALADYVTATKILPPNDMTSNLGRYKASVAYDDARKERYISYYDLWDLDPPILKKLDIDIDQFNYPFEVYGRVYESDVATFAQERSNSAPAVAK